MEYEIKGRTKKILEHPAVVSQVRSCLESDYNDGGFLIYLREDGEVLTGSAVSVNEGKFGNMRRQLSETIPDRSHNPTEDESRSILKIVSEYAVEELADYLTAYQQLHGTIDSRHGTVFLTHWRFDELTPEIAKQIMRYTGKDRKIARHPLQFETSVPISQRVQLNELRKAHSDVILVSGIKHYRNIDEVSLLIYRQKVGYMDFENLLFIDIADKYGTVSPEIAQIAEECDIYEKRQGIFDLGKRSVVFT